MPDSAPAGTIAFLVAASQSTAEALVAGLDTSGFDVTVHGLGTTAGAADYNAAVQRSDSTFMAFVGPGVTLDRNWLTAAFDCLERHDEFAAVSSRFIRADGAAQPRLGLTITGRPAATGWDTTATEPRLLWASRNAMLIQRDAFIDIGGFDEQFHSALADVDLGWRLWISGWGIVEAARAVATGEPMASLPNDVPTCVEAFTLLYKNCTQPTLTALLPAAFALTAQRDPAVGGEAIAQFSASLRKHESVRASVQSERRRDDAEILPLLRLPFTPDALEPAYAGNFERIASDLGARAAFGNRRRVVVVTPDVVTEKMAGPAIRSWTIATFLAEEHDVILASTRQCTITHPDFLTGTVSYSTLKDLEEWCDVLIFQGEVMFRFPYLATSRKVIVADVYDPLHLESLEQLKDETDGVRGAISLEILQMMNQQLQVADYLLCASEKQRDLWLGHLGGLGRLNPRTYDVDDTLRSIIDVVPFGLPEEPPVQTEHGIKGTVPGIGPDDKVIIWGGGIWNWFDPITLIEAVNRVKDRHPNVRLFFLGMQHPNPHIPKMRKAADAVALSDTLGLTDKHVFFNEGWVPYETRANYLLDADIAVSCHLDHVETTFSFRTRMLDYLWAGLPTVGTAGDSLGDLIQMRGAGLAVPVEDVDALDAALSRLLEDDTLRAECRAHARELAEQFQWRRALAPLLAFCRNPRRAPDTMWRHDDESGADTGAPARTSLTRAVSEYGLRGASRRAFAKARRMMSGPSTDQH